MKPRRAFSLAEVIMAVIIVMIGMYAVVRISPGGQRAAVVSKERMLALRLARNVLEEARSLPFGSDLSKLQGPVSLAAELVEGNPVGQEFVVTEVKATIPPLPVVPPPPMGVPLGFGTPVAYGVINVTVAWRDVGGNLNPSDSSKSLTLSGGLSREP